MTQFLEGPNPLPLIRKGGDSNYVYCPASFLTNSKFYFIKINNAGSFQDDMNDITVN